MLTLYQAEWCPYSSAVRELLSEHGIDFVARQVEPWPEDRAALKELSGDDGIPVLVDEQGTLHRGIREILAYLATLEEWPHAADHRQRYRDHQSARAADATGQLIEQTPRRHERQPSRRADKRAGHAGGRSASAPPAGLSRAPEDDRVVWTASTPVPSRRTAAAARAAYPARHVDY